jgi:co-chaperonin GroES (HSP10)
MTTAEARAKLPFKRVMNGHLIVQIDDFAYRGRIVIPDTAKRKPTKGVVAAVADNITDVKVGEKILYSQFAGYLLKFNDLPLYRCIGYDEILAILEDDAPEIEAEGA